MKSSVESFEERAAEYRRLADKTEDEWLRETCLRLAARYEKLARDPDQSHAAEMDGTSLDQLWDIAAKHS